MSQLQQICDSRKYCEKVIDSKCLDYSARLDELGAHNLLGWGRDNDERLQLSAVSDEGADARIYYSMSHFEALWDQDHGNLQWKMCEFENNNI